jgi:hypothetical protein
MIYALEFVGWLAMASGILLLLLGMGISKASLSFFDDVVRFRSNTHFMTVCILG